MPNSMMLLLRARLCPFACLLKIVFLLLFLGALCIAIYFQDSMSFHAYSGIIIAIGYVAMIALVTNSHCRLKISEIKRDTAGPHHTR